MHVLTSLKAFVKSSPEDILIGSREKGREEERGRETRM